MSNILLCNEPTPRPCKPAFRLRASGWIDRNNVGSSRRPIATDPPAGIRLRWNWPFLAADPAGRMPYPREFVVRRSDDVDREFFRPVPNAGSTPRSYAPQDFWRPMDRVTDFLFTVGANPCESGDAVYFEIHPQGRPVSVTLHSATNSTVVIANLSPGDRFYYEMLDIHSVAFSTYPRLAIMPTVLDLKRGLQSVDINTRVIATVDARVWLGETIGQIGQRLALANTDPYVATTFEEWELLQQKGRTVIEAHDRGDPISREDLDALLFLSGEYFETSLLIGWGFLDGEHPPGPGYDAIDEAEMMAEGTAGNFAYEIETEIVDPDTGQSMTVTSSPFFTTTDPMRLLSTPRPTARSAPQAEARLVSGVSIGPSEDHPDVSGGTREAVYCNVEYDFATTNSLNERLFTTPMASASALTGDVFQGVGEIRWSAADLPVVIDGLTTIETRSHDFEIPFFDSSVWLEFAVADHWDRYLGGGSTGPVFPRARYRGRAVPAEKATCDGRTRVATVDLFQNDWRADRLARLARGRVELLARVPLVEKTEVVVNVGPAFVARENYWAAVVKPAIPRAERNHLVNGTFMVGGFVARIEEFSVDASGEQVCMFEADAHCGAADLYGVDLSGTTEATLVESDDSERLWVIVATAAVLGDGRLELYTKTAAIQSIIEPTTSLTFWFATRMAIFFQGETLVGPVTAPIPAPYLHEPPQPPELCVQVSQLGTDYYGRSVLRIRAGECEELDEQYACVLVCAEGDIEDPEELSLRRTKGIFGPERPFRQKALFDAFSIVAGAVDGAPYSLGISYLRESDGAESPPLIIPFLAREIEK